MMSLHEKIAKLPEEQLGIELTDEEISKVSGGFKEMFECRNYVSKEAFLSWDESCADKCNNCHLYYQAGSIDRGYDGYKMEQFVCRDLGAVRQRQCKI